MGAPHGNDGMRSGAMAALTVTSHWRDRLYYGTVIPALCIVVGATMLLLAPPPPSVPAALAFYGMTIGFIIGGVGFALTAWRSRFIVSPSGIVVHQAIRQRLFPWDRLEAITLDRPHRYAGRHGRGPRWQALHVHATDERMPVIAAATNRPKRHMPDLVNRVDQALAPYGHRVQQH